MRKLIFAIVICLPSLAFSQVTKIFTIQGNGFASPLVSQTVTTEGVVYADFQGTGLLNGFFIQDTLGDSNPLTSDGIFIYSPGGTNVNVGDYVSVTGVVAEYYELTQIGNVTNISVLGSVTNMIVPSVLVLPVATMNEMEALEGMYITCPQSLIVTDNYNLGKYGEFTIATERLTIPTNNIDPNDASASGTTSSGSSNVAAIDGRIDLNNRSRILVDDNKTSSYPNPVPYVDPSTKTLRCGSTVQNISGAFSYSFSKYRLMPTITPTFVYNSRPTVPIVSGDVKVASFNILNFFSTIDNGSNNARGADSQLEYIRQRDKLVAALDSLNADIYALIEVENNVATPDSIVNALNTALGSQVYAVATESPFTGSYAIKNIFIYRISSVTPLDSMITSTDLLFYPPPIARQFEVNATGGRFNLVANHYRYKGCDDAIGLDLDQLDGQGCYNEARRQQSLEMLNFLDYVDSLTMNDQNLMVGDFNAYEQEDPIDIFVGAGYAKIINNDYSYSYRSEFGSLDHVLASPSLSGWINEAKIWHINSDEPVAQDYNTESIVDDLYEANPYRSSDHDPILIGLSPAQSTATIDELNMKIAVFPNPFQEELTFETAEVVDIQLTDVSGRILKVIPSVLGTYKLNTTEFAQGIILVTYFVNSNPISTQRVIKQ